MPWAKHHFNNDVEGLSSWRLVKFDKPGNQHHGRPMKIDVGDQHVTTAYYLQTYARNDLTACLRDGTLIKAARTAFRPIAKSSLRAAAAAYSVGR